MGVTTLSRRSFNERLLETLPVPPAERDQMRDQARKAGAAFARDLVSLQLEIQTSTEGLALLQTDLSSAPVDEKAAGGGVE